MGRRSRGFEVSTCLPAVAAIEADLVRLAAAMTENQFHAQPPAGGWSAAFCIEHLVLTGQAFLSKWDTALGEAVLQKQSGSGPFSYRWWQRALLHWAEPPYRIKTRAASQFVPRARRPMQDVVGRFLRMHTELKRRIESSLGIDAARTKVQSPFVSWIWYPLGFSFDLALAHERRHLWQAWQVRDRLFGASGTRLPAAAPHD